MSDEALHALPEDAADPVAANGAVGRSVVDRIRQRNAARKRHIDLPIPRWEGDVVVRYGPLSKSAIVNAGRRRGNPARSNAELLVAACQEVLVRDDDGNLIPASVADGQPAPIRFDGRLADLFEIQAETPIDVVLRMYADDVVVGAHAKRVYDWQTGEDLAELTADELDELAGEAQAAT